MSEPNGASGIATGKSADDSIRQESCAIGDLTVAIGARNAPTGSDRSGGTVVLVHGLAQDHYSWIDCQQRMAGFTSVSYDLRGHGSTTLGEAVGSIAQFAGDLCGLLEEVTGPAYCVGHSLGGTIALWAAAIRPDLVRGLVVSATSSVLSKAGYEFYADKIASFAEPLDVQQVQETVAADTRRMARPGPGIDVEAIIERRLRAVGDGQGYLNALRALAGMRSEPLQQLLPEVRCRVLSISGEHDQLCPPRAAEILLSALRFGQGVTLSGAGHMVSLDRPAEYCAAIEQFIASQE